MSHGARGSSAAEQSLPCTALRAREEMPEGPMPVPGQHWFCACWVLGWGGGGWTKERELGLDLAALGHSDVQGGRRASGTEPSQGPPEA